MFHQVSRRQSALHAVVIKQFASGANGKSAFFDDPSGEWDVTGDNNVAREHHFDNSVVGDVSAVRNGNNFD